MYILKQRSVLFYCWQFLLFPFIPKLSVNAAEYVLGLVLFYAGLAAEKEALDVKEETARFSRESAETAMATEEPIVRLVVAMAGAM